MSNVMLKLGKTHPCLTKGSIIGDARGGGQPTPSGFCGFQLMPSSSKRSSPWKDAADPNWFQNQPLGAQGCDCSDLGLVL